MAAIDLHDYLGLVRWLARKKHRSLPRVAANRTPYEDLVGYGWLGLVEAGERYDPSRGVPFIAFSRPRIVGAMEDALRAADPLSKGERATLQKIHEAERTVLAQLGRPATVEEVAAAVGMTPSDVERLLPHGEMVEYDDRNPDHARAGKATPEAEAARRELGRATQACLEALGREQRYLMTSRQLDKMTLEAVGRVLRMSKDRIARRERAVCQALRICLAGKGWEATDVLETLNG